MLASHQQSQLANSSHFFDLLAEKPDGIILFHAHGDRVSREHLRSSCPGVATHTLPPVLQSEYAPNDDAVYLIYGKCTAKGTAYHPPNARKNVGESLKVFNRLGTLTPAYHGGVPVSFSCMIVGNFFLSIPSSVIGSSAPPQVLHAANLREGPKREGRGRRKHRKDPLVV